MREEGRNIHFFMSKINHGCLPLPDYLETLFSSSRCKYGHRLLEMRKKLHIIRAIIGSVWGETKRSVGGAVAVWCTLELRRSRRERKKRCGARWTFQNQREYIEYSWACKREILKAFNRVGRERARISNQFNEDLRLFFSMIIISNWMGWENEDENL